MVRTRTKDPEDATSARLDMMERMIMEMVETLRQQQQQQQQPPPPPIPPPVVQDFHVEDQTITRTKELNKMKPPSFKGGIEPMKAEYFPQSMRDKKVTEFDTRRQGNKTVAEYEAQFAELARFAPHMVDTDYKKARKFEGGLRSAILDKVNMLKLPTYVDVLERAVIAEGNLVTQNRISKWKGKGQNTEWSKGTTTPPNKKQNLGTSNTSTPSQDSIPVCPKCGKKHHGTCYRKSGACFHCGKPGHLIRDCPQRNQQNINRAATSSAGSTPTPNTKTTAKPTNNKDTARQGRVFTLVPGDVQNAATVVSVKPELPSRIIIHHLRASSSNVNAANDTF
ncbi:uncharacterized protein LOC114321289 [Camellia sinensis]|uniref:uncharacterized protein LOC114321289 n=1 Tax=Camellia sinensis TaxID=4442 RepID=UPI0010365232|nr:uncharacterized protein LOC114321289 [Camellia sinensis]